MPSRPLLEGIELSDDASFSLEMVLEAVRWPCIRLTTTGRRGSACELRTSRRSPIHDRFIVALLTGIAAELEGDYDRGAALAGEASEIAERIVDPRCLIWLAGSVGRVGELG